MVSRVLIAAPRSASHEASQQGLLHRLNRDARDEISQG
jgi:hypothetical protein